MNNEDPRLEFLRIEFENSLKKVYETLEGCSAEDITIGENTNGKYLDFTEETPTGGARWRVHFPGPTTWAMILKDINEEEKTTWGLLLGCYTVLQRRIKNMSIEKTAMKILEIDEEITALREKQEVMRHYIRGGMVSAIEGGEEFPCVEPDWSEKCDWIKTTKRYGGEG